MLVFQKFYLRTKLVSVLRKLSIGARIWLEMDEIFMDAWDNKEESASWYRHVLLELLREDLRKVQMMLKWIWMFKIAFREIPWNCLKRQKIIFRITLIFPLDITHSQLERKSKKYKYQLDFCEQWNIKWYTRSLTPTYLKTNRKFSEYSTTKNFTRIDTN